MNEGFERQLFKLPTGYLHLYADGIAFTRSGNWEEAAGTKERSSRLAPRQVVRVVLGVMILIAGAVFYTLKGRQATGDAAFVIALTGAAFGLHRLFGNMKDDFAQSFRIPFPKIRSMLFNDGELTIAFVNGAWKEDEIRPRLEPALAERIKAAWASRRDRSN